MEKMDKHQNRGGSASNKDFFCLFFVIPFTYSSLLQSTGLESEK